MSFENLHKNKKLAFLDGFLCGVVITIIVAGTKYFDKKDELEYNETFLKKKTSRAYHDGYDDAMENLPVKHYEHCFDPNCVHRTIMSTDQ